MNKLLLLPLLLLLACRPSKEEILKANVPTSTTIPISDMVRGKVANVQIPKGEVFHQHLASHSGNVFLVTRVEGTLNYRVYKEQSDSNCNVFWFELAREYKEAK